MPHIVRYKLKADRVAENEAFVAKVFEELKRVAPQGLHYATFKLDDGVSFMHLVYRETPEGSPNQLTTLSLELQGVRRRRAGPLRGAAGDHRGEGNRLVCLPHRIALASRRSSRRWKKGAASSLRSSTMCGPTCTAIAPA